MQTRGTRRILGAVLAGGQSRRFGSDKALAVLRGRVLIEHASEALARHTDEVVICGREYPPHLKLMDRPAADMGPLGGLNAALHHAAANGFDGVLCTGCDMPVFPAALAAALIGSDAAVVEGQYLMGYWPAALAPELDTHLGGSADRSVRAWLAVARPRRVTGPDLPNINTPDDLGKLEADG